jgi:hypothetical protein
MMNGPRSAVAQQKVSFETFCDAAGLPARLIARADEIIG